MRAFFSQIAERDDLVTPKSFVTPGENTLTSESFFARIAVYDSQAAAPRIEDITTTSPLELIEVLSTKTYMLARDHGGSIPYTVIREIVENLLHANLNEVVVSILDNGSVLRFTDQGPGIPDKDRALMPGFTTATYCIKRFIRGVGSGLPIVREFLANQGGRLSIEDNLGSGTVVTLYAAGGNSPSSPRHDSLSSDSNHEHAELFFPRLTTRQKKVLSLILELGEVGPTLVSKELSVGLSTAHRDLAYLEAHGLISSDETGKRELTEIGALYLDKMFL